MIQNNCQAVISTPEGSLTYVFPDQATASAWVASKAGSGPKGMWGQNAVAAQPAVMSPDIPAVPATPAVPAVLDSNGNIITPAVPANPGSPEIPARVLIPAQPAIAQAWSVVYSDVSAQAAQQASVSKGLARQDAGAQIIAQVYAINEANIASGTLSQANLLAMLEDAGLAQIERLLWNGSLGSALALIQASTSLPSYFSSAQISQIESAISAAIAANP